MIEEPLMHYGEGKFNPNVIKKVEVTEDLLNFDQSDLQCQNDQSYENCTTEAHLSTLLNECNCLPLSLRTQESQVAIIDH